MPFQSTKVYFQITKVYFQSTKVYIPSAKVHFQKSTKIYFQITRVYFQRTTVYFRSTKYTFKVYKSALSKYKSILSKYKSIHPECKSILSKYKVTFGTFGTESPESGTFSCNTFGSQNPSEPVPSKPREQNLTQSIEWFPESVPGPWNPGTYPNLGTHRNRFPEPLEPVPGTSEPWSLSKPRNPLEPVPGTSELWNLGTRNLGPKPRNPSELSRNPPGTFPEPVFSRNRPSSPSTHRNIYWAETP